MINHANYLLQLPNVLEIVGTGYSVWFITRYLLFKVCFQLYHYRTGISHAWCARLMIGFHYVQESRDELFAKFEDLKDNII